MLMSTVNQAYIFLSTVYGGIIIGFIYDLYRMIRRILHPKWLMTAFFDLLFWLSCAVFSFGVLYYANDGEIRIFTFLGFILGGALYMLALSPLVMGFFYWSTKLVRKVFAYVTNVLMVPIQFIWNIIKIPAKALKTWIEPARKGGADEIDQE